MSEREAPKSAVVIARLLSAQGFDNETANLVDRYYRKRLGLTARQLKSLDEKEAALKKIAAEKLDAGERMVLGRFVGLHKHMAFDAGLRIGLTAKHQTCDLTPAEVEEEMRRFIGPSPARAIAAYHAMTTGQDVPEAPDAD
jgi:hypothetical protein